MGRWRNGRRGRLKSGCPKGHVGSLPAGRQGFPPGPSSIHENKKGGVNEKAGRESQLDWRPRTGAKAELRKAGDGSGGHHRRYYQEVLKKRRIPSPRGEGIFLSLTLRG